jgi:putative transposase
LWELREVKAQLRREGREEVDEPVIFETYERLNRIVEDASAHTVSARKAVQKKRNRSQKQELERAQAGQAPARQLRVAAEEAWADDDVAPFGVLKVK